MAGKDGSGEDRVLRRENLTKTLTLSDFQLVSGELIPHHVVMANNVQGTRTILELQDVSQEDVSPDVFTVRNLRR